MGDKWNDNTGGGVGIKERQEVERKVERPKLFKVLLHNDHYTTMEFVVEVLQYIFHKSASEAVTIMLAVHQQGVGVAGVYPAAIAETKINAVHALAEKEGFPLKCSMEPE